MKNVFKTASLILAISISACAKKVDENKIRSDVYKEIAGRISQKYGTSRDIKLVELSLVNSDGSKFDGSAKISVSDKMVNAPFKVYADPQNVVLDFGFNEIDGALQEKENETQIKKSEELAKFSSLIESLGSGVYSDKIFKSDFRRIYPKSLASKISRFKANMDTIVPIEVNGDGYLGSGCRAHECGSHEAAWHVSKDGSRMIVIIMDRNKNFPDLVSYEIYGSSYKNLPQSLLEWGGNAGMTEFNSAQQGLKF